MSPKVLRLPKRKPLPVEAIKPEYYFEDGLRKIKPYQQTYLAHVKLRWHNRTVPEVFASEMPRRCTNNMIIAAMKRGDVLVNDKVIAPDYVLKGGESLRSLNCHRHEPPVPDSPIRIIENTKDYVVFDKPHGITVHPNELCFYNTALEILRRDHDIPNYMHAVNRLDAVTSGVVIFANMADSNVRKRFQSSDLDPKNGSNTLIEKEYVCRVEGEFPKNPIIVREPILQRAGKVSIDLAGKPSETRFERKWYDAASNTSLISCLLATGRQHQIRLHVAHLGHPIVNDRLYNPKYKTDMGLENENAVILATEETRFYPCIIPPELQPYMPYYISPETPCHKCIEEEKGLNLPNPRSMKIWLRAIRYQGPDWKFEVDMPDWADPTILE
ncbi:RNA pseudouridylate synthase domain containing protein 2 [Lobosporangium transversale]|uniref:Pseudouridine synthase n=1 Tax=Lobosporangium transversale TaxID=64571 RepID=A0A1Y2G7R2_9FUNG|nr:pseudouridine synthase [Lobosporangium transversale]KAF9917999.1 RNA pseudouridylate synthase domain containing protein 2 [Lobosporangium transversale]ORY96992.1 pseudouridine synthase [Lobosporangium transversale]|eukprot:XP_021875554.1 pseudouridine synthase [Lobosporangium transversale]